jgi:hypothetical protein
VLVRAAVLPDVLAAAQPQALSNIAWSLGKLSQLRGWKGGEDEETIAQLLGEQQLQLVSSTGTAQGICNVLLGLAYMATAATPIISMTFAQQCSKQLLADTVQALVKSDPRNVCNVLLVCGELRLAHAPVVAAGAATAASWVPNTLSQQLCQATISFNKLQCENQKASWAHCCSMGKSYCSNPPEVSSSRGLHEDDAQGPWKLTE